MTELSASEITDIILEAKRLPREATGEVDALLARLPTDAPASQMLYDKFDVRNILELLGVEGRPSEHVDQLRRWRPLVDCAVAHMRHGYEMNPKRSTEDPVRAYYQPVFERIDRAAKAGDDTRLIDALALLVNSIVWE